MGFQVMRSVVSRLEQLYGAICGVEKNCLLLDLEAELNIPVDRVTAGSLKQFLAEIRKDKVLHHEA